MDGLCSKFRSAEVIEAFVGSARQLYRLLLVLTMDISQSLKELSVATIVKTLA